MLHKIFSSYSTHILLQNAYDFVNCASFNINTAYRLSIMVVYGVFIRLCHLMCKHCRLTHWWMQSWWRLASSPMTEL